MRIQATANLLAPVPAIRKLTLEIDIEQLGALMGLIDDDGAERDPPEVDARLTK